GRGREIEKANELIDGGTRLVGLQGDSGVGKSSLVRGGILPTLGEYDLIDIVLTAGKAPRQVRAEALGAKGLVIDPNSVHPGGYRGDPHGDGSLAELFADEAAGARGPAEVAAEMAAHLGK